MLKDTSTVRIGGVSWKQLPRPYRMNRTQQRRVQVYIFDTKSSYTVDWNQVNWVTVNKLIRNLQRRIFRARKLGGQLTGREFSSRRVSCQWKQLRRLQKLLLRSYAKFIRICKTELPKIIKAKTHLE